MEVAFEPILAPIAITRYEGATNEDGRPEGQGVGYFIGGHKYIGEFEDGYMSGKGKYEWSDGVTYSGDFMAGKIEGSGVFKWPMDFATYEGEVQGGKKHGHGTLYFETIPISYTGEWKNGLRHGKGKLSFDKENVAWYDGEWCEGKKCGMGTLQYASGNRYEGYWKDDEKCGHGTMYWNTSNEIYCGQWEHGLTNGEGEHVWLNGAHLTDQKVPGTAVNDNAQFLMCNHYKGEFKDGKRKGRGTFFYATGARYQGEWHDNKKHGMGAFTFEDGTVFEGMFDTDRPQRNDGVAAELGEVVMEAPSMPAIIYIDDLLEEEENPEVTFATVTNILLRYNTELKAVYRFYSAIGRQATDERSSDDANPNKTFMLNVGQFSHFVRDCYIPSKDFPMARLNMVLLTAKTDQKGIKEGTHNPQSLVLFREFVEGLVRIAHYQFHALPALERRVHHLINQCVLPHATKRTFDDITIEYRSEEVQGFLKEHELAFKQLYCYLVRKNLPPPEEDETVPDLVLMNEYAHSITGRDLIDLLQESSGIDTFMSLRMALTQMVKVLFPTPEDKNAKPPPPPPQPLPEILELDEEGEEVIPPDPPEVYDDDYHVVFTELVYAEFVEVLCFIAHKWQQDKLKAEYRHELEERERLLEMEDMDEMPEATEEDMEPVNIELKPTTFMDALNGYLLVKLFPYCPEEAGLRKRYPQPEPEPEPADETGEHTEDEDLVESAR